MENSNKPLVSVCMITYNHEAFIEEAINGVLMQLCDFEVELIISDDCSTDSTEEKINTLINNHEKGRIIKYTRHKSNLGMMPNFINALNKCSGKYIALCDGDDYWIDNLKLKKQVDLMEKHRDVAITFHPCVFLDEKLNAFRKQNISTIDYDYSFKNLLVNWYIPTASILFRNNGVINNLPLWFIEVASGDIALVMLLFEQGEFKLIEEHMSVYRQNASGVSVLHNKTRMIHYRSFLYNRLNEHFNYKYEEDIYEALFELMQVYKPDLVKWKKELTAKELLIALKDKFVKKLKL